MQTYNLSSVCIVLCVVIPVRRLVVKTLSGCVASDVHVMQH